MNVQNETNELSLDMVLHIGIGAALAVAVAVMVVWPQVQSMVV